MNLSTQDRELAAVLAAIKKIDTSDHATYLPYPKQRLFHASGLTHRERLLRAGNQNGKTFAGGLEMAYHLTGLYPKWWDGRRFDGPIVGWAGSDTSETTRDNPQRALLGMVGEFGTGAIPSHCILGMKAARSVADLQDYVKIQHYDKHGKRDGISTLRFKFYEQGRQKWQGPKVHVVWFDEEPPEPIYDEGMARTIATGGMGYLTFTPLRGMSEVVRRFLSDPGVDRHDTNMTIEDAEHIPEDERKRIIASFAAHEREARAKGIPTLGSGKIFPISEDEIKYEAKDFPAHFVWIGALDFGWDHPTAAVKLCWDRDADIVYVTQAYKRKQATPLIHAGALRPWGDWLPWAWPHDGLQHDKGSGEMLASQYKAQGLAMLSERAKFEDGSNGVEAGLMDMLDRMQTGRLKVASHLVEWCEEFRLYHRKDGQVVKNYDDLMAATRYGIMCLRFAVVEGGENYSYDNVDGCGTWMG